MAKSRWTLLLVGLCVGLSSCATIKFQSSVDDKYNDGAVVITVLGVERDTALGFGAAGIDFAIQNGTDSPITIKWNNSTIDYNGSSHQVFLTGEKFIDAGREIPDRTIAQGSQIQIGVFPADNVVFREGQYGGWSINPINATRVSATVCASVSGSDRYYTANVTVEH
jgi:hypothetical protein